MSVNNFDSAHDMKNIAPRSIFRISRQFYFPKCHLIGRFWPIVVAFLKKNVKESTALELKHDDECRFSHFISQRSRDKNLRCNDHVTFSNAIRSISISSKQFIYSVAFAAFATSEMKITFSPHDVEKYEKH